jgi:hypothetical protein
MARWVLIMAFAGAGWFGFSTHAVTSEIHSLQAQYAHVTNTVSRANADITQDESNVGAGASTMGQAPGELQTATSDIQQVP